MAGNAETMVLASFAADALALGAHWIYDTRQIDARFGRVADFLKPSPPTYHPAKACGELTHYGDQTLVLLRSVSACGGFDDVRNRSRLPRHGSPDRKIRGPAGGGPD